MPTVVTLSHSLKGESICQDVGVSLCTYSHLYIIRLEIISMGVNVCWGVGCKWENAFLMCFVMIQTDGADVLFFVCFNSLLTLLTPATTFVEKLVYI